MRIRNSRKDVITPNGLLVLKVIAEKYAAGHSASTRDILAALGNVSLHGLQHHLNRLRRLGLITWDYGKSRTLRPTFKLFIPPEQEIRYSVYAEFQVGPNYQPREMVVFE